MLSWSGQGHRYIYLCEFSGFYGIYCTADSLLDFDIREVSRCLFTNPHGVQKQKAIVRPTCVLIHLYHEILAVITFVTCELSALLEDAVSYSGCIANLLGYILSPEHSRTSCLKLCTIIVCWLAAFVVSITHT
jgi:hypothetical protein